jgi:hypothetical protein
MHPVLIVLLCFLPLYRAQETCLPAGDANCVCAAGYIGEVGGPCEPCSAGSYCPDASTELECPLGMSNSAASMGDDYGNGVLFVFRTDPWAVFYRGTDLTSVKYKVIDGTVTDTSRGNYLNFNRQELTAPDKTDLSACDANPAQCSVNLNGEILHPVGGTHRVAGIVLPSQTAFYLHYEKFYVDPADTAQGTFTRAWITLSFDSNFSPMAFVIPADPLLEECYSLSMDSDEILLYVTMNTGLYVHNLATGDFTLLYNSRVVVAASDMSLDYQYIYLSVASDTAGRVDVLRYHIGSNEVTPVVTLDGVDYMCTNPTANAVAYTYNQRLYVIEHGYSRRLLGTPDGVAGTETIISSMPSYDLNLQSGSEHRCANYDSTFTKLIVASGNKPVYVLMMSDVPAISDAAQTSVTDCYCPISSHGEITDADSYCEKCPQHSTTTEAGATSYLDCVCEDGYERLDGSFTCTACDPVVGCSGSGGAPSQLIVKFSVTASTKNILVHKDTIRVNVATQLGLPEANVIFVKASVLSVPFRRRLLQSGELSQVELALVPVSSGDSNADLLSLSNTVSADAVAVGGVIAASIGPAVTATLTGTTCPTLQVPQGYQLNAQMCVLEDIDECVQQNPCHEIAYCTNTVGDSYCTCPVGTFGDGYNCEANALAARITLRTDAPQSVVDADFAPALRRLFAAMLLTGTLVPTNGSLAMAEQGVLNTMVLPNSQILITVDMLFGLAVDQHDAVNRFDNVAFSAAVAQLPAEGSGYFVVVEFGVRKATLNGELVDSVMLYTAVGLEVLSMEFDRACMIEGCWRVVVRYSGGGSSTVSSVYLPKTDVDENGVYTTTFLDTFNPNFFPCGGANAFDPTVSSFSQSLTACCVPRYVSRYHTTYDMEQHTKSAGFLDAMALCSDTDAGAAPPANGLLAGSVETGGDFVAGPIQNMISSHADYRGVVHPDTNTHEIELLLDEKELRERMGVIEGNLQSAYTIKSFVGMAHFTPSPTGTFMRSVSAQTKLALHRTNYFTLSASGPVDFTVLEFSSAELHTVKVQVGMEMQRVQYASIQIVLKEDYSLPADGPFPLDGVLVGKGARVADATYVYACHNAESTAIFDNGFTVSKYADAKAQTECAPQRDMCVQSSFVQGRALMLNVPLGVDFFTDEDLQSDGTTNIFIDVATTLIASNLQSIVSVFRASIPLLQAGIIRHCENLEATVDLTGLVSVDIVVGTDLPFNATPAAGTLVDSVNIAPGHTERVNVSAASKENAMLSLVLQGDRSFFELTDRYYLDLNDVMTLHFLESSPVVYTQVLNLVNTGRAFDVVTSSGLAYAQPTAELLQLCPFTMRPNYFACVMHRVVSKTQIVAGVNGAPSMRIAEFDGASNAPTTQFIRSYLGSSSQFVTSRATDFWSNVTRSYSINNRYNRAWAISPANSWQIRDVNAIGQTQYTLQDRFLMFALVALRDSTAGATVGRRLLQVGAPRASRSDAMQSTAVYNAAIHPLVQTCGNFGFEVSSCAAIHVEMSLPFKNVYCDIWTSAVAYDTLVDDITAASEVVLATASLRGAATWRIVPTDLVNVIALNCAAAVGTIANARRLLQTGESATALTAVDIIIKSSDNSSITIDFAAAASSPYVRNIRSYDDVPGAATAQNAVYIVSDPPRKSTSDELPWVWIIVVVVVFLLVLVGLKRCVVFDDPPPPDSDTKGLISKRGRP